MCTNYPFKTGGHVGIKCSSFQKYKLQKVQDIGELDLFL